MMLTAACVCVCLLLSGSQALVLEKDAGSVEGVGVQVEPRGKLFTRNLTMATFLQSLDCVLCVDFVTSVQLDLEAKADAMDVDIIEAISVYVCLHGGINGDMGEPVDYDVCYGTVHEFAVQVVYIVFESVLSANSLCSYFGACPPRPPYAWNVTFSQTPKPPVSSPPKVAPNSPKYRILQLSDIHYDPLYTPGTTTDCGEPVCCRSTNAPGNGTSVAGYWGDYRNCDTPLWTYENLLQTVASLYAADGGIDFVLYTGDSPVHAVWETTPQGNVDIMNVTYSLVRQYLPNAKFFGSIGNHEPSPVDLDPPPGVYPGKDDSVNIQWLYDGAASIWGEFLDSNALSTLQYAGYYSMRIDESLIVIALNMNFGDSENYWLLVNPVDPAGMIQWLSDQLQQAEDNGDKVIIIGHQKSSGSLHSFSWVYFDLILRYESTVVGQFFGHSHEDYFISYLDPTNTSRGFSSAYICPSVTTYSYLNVGFRIYEMDVESKWITDAYTYTFNLTEANLINDPTNPGWFLEYSAREAYGFTGDVIGPQDWADLTVALETDDVKWNDFLTYQVKSAPTGPCEGACRSGTICDLRTGRENDFSACQSPSQEEMNTFFRGKKRHC